MSKKRASGLMHSFCDVREAGSGCEHYYMIKLLTDIHEKLDQKDDAYATYVIAVNLRKAFNTMDHHACMHRSVKKG